MIKTPEYFYLLCYFIIAIVLTSTVFISFFKNSVFSIFLLITIFTLSSILILFLNLEFTAFIVLSVYVGAIAVLFIFVLLLLDTKYLDDENDLWASQGSSLNMNFFIQHKFKFFIFGGALLASLLIILPILDYFLIFIEFSNKHFDKYFNILYGEFIISNIQLEMSNLNVTAMYLYNPDLYGYYIILSSILLLVPMVGAIAIIMERRPSIQRQDIILQNRRSAVKSISFFK